MESLNAPSWHVLLRAEGGLEDVLPRRRTRGLVTRGTRRRTPVARARRGEEKSK